MSDSAPAPRRRARQGRSSQPKKFPMMGGRIPAELKQRVNDELEDAGVRTDEFLQTLLEAWIAAGSKFRNGAPVFLNSPRAQIVVEPTSDYSAAPQIPCYGSVSAGPGALISGTVEERLPCPPWITKPDDRLFALRVDGSSMIPTLLPGDVVIVRGGQDATTGEMVIAQIEDEQGEPRGYVKYLRVEGTQRFLVSENEEGNPRRHLPRNASIVGKVIGAVRYLEGKDLIPAHLWASSGVLRLPDPGSAGGAADIFSEARRIRERDEGR